MTATTYATGGDRCGKCGHEWPDAPPPGDELRREVIGSWVTDGCAKCRPAPERKPAAGWAMRSRALWLKAAGYLAQVQTDGKKPGRWSLWLVSPNAGGGWTEVRGDDAPSVEAAQLAAEDALRAIAAEILRAVPR